jgi:hypothetical protein
VTPSVTRKRAFGDKVILASERKGLMRCEFCNQALPDSLPDNIALLSHVAARQDCNEQFGYLLENLRASWTPAMSGG